MRNGINGIDGINALVCHSGQSAVGLRRRAEDAQGSQPAGDDGRGGCVHTAHGLADARWHVRDNGHGQQERQEPWQRGGEGDRLWTRFDLVRGRCLRTTLFTLDGRGAREMRRTHTAHGR